MTFMHLTAIRRSFVTNVPERVRKKREGLKRERGKEKKCSEEESCDVCLAVLIACSHVCM